MSKFNEKSDKCALKNYFSLELMIYVCRENPFVPCRI